MTLQTLPTLAGLDAPVWDALVPGTQPFLRHAFLTALEDSGSVGAGTGWEPAHQLWLGADGRVRAALPAWRKLHSLGEYVFDRGWADACHRAGIAYYPKLLAAVPFTPVAGPRLLGEPLQVTAMLDALEPELTATGLSGLHINFTEADDNQLLQARPGWLPRLDCQFHWRNRGYGDFADFLGTLRSDKRKKMRKERESVAGQGIRFDWRSGAALSEAEWDFVFDCYANTYLVRGQRPYLTRDFFSLLAERMPEVIRVVLARQGSRPVAMAFSLVSAGVLYGRYWGCLDSFHALHFETCFYQGLELALAEGLQSFNAGAQGEHKLIRGFEPVVTQSWHYLCHPGLRRAVGDYLQQERQQVLAYADAAAAALPYRRDQGVMLEIS